MNYLICRNKVANFDQWKRVFDSHAEAQTKAGLRIERIWRGLDNAHDVFMLFAVDDLDKAKAFLNSPSVPDAQRTSGMIDKPDNWFVQST